MDHRTFWMDSDCPDSPFALFLNTCAIVAFRYHVVAFRCKHVNQCCCQLLNKRLLRHFRRFSKFGRSLCTIKSPPTTPFSVFSPAYPSIPVSLKSATIPLFQKNTSLQIEKNGKKVSSKKSRVSCSLPILPNMGHISNTSAIPSVDKIDPSYLFIVTNIWNQKGERQTPLSRLRWWSFGVSFSPHLRPRAPRTLCHGLVRFRQNVYQVYRSSYRRRKGQKRVYGSVSWHFFPDPLWDSSQPLRHVRDGCIVSYGAFFRPQVRIALSVR